MIKYSSTLCDYMTAYVKHLQSQGFKANDVKYTLYSFDHFLCEINFKNSFIDMITINKWFETIKSERCTTIYHKISVLRRFTIFMSRLGVECYIPRLPKKHDSGFIPYIFSDNEISRIFEACDNLREIERHPESVMIAIPALIRLMYSTAIRVSEALAIRNIDVNFESHAILLNTTKNGSPRLAPINKAMEFVLKDYIHYRNRLNVNNIALPEQPFFVSSIGRPISRRTVGSYFNKILREAKISRNKTDDGPRLHDLRHSACVHSMIRLSRADLDLYCYLPILSTFMGHKKVIDTEKYLRLTFEMYPELINQDSSITSCITGLIKRTLN